MAEDAEARFARFVAERGARIVVFATLITRDRAYAEDLVQDCLMKAYVRWRRAGAPDHPEAYVRRAVVNAVVSGGRRKVVEPARLVAADSSPSIELAHAERDAMWSALGELPPRQRAVLVLRYYEDLADDEIAKVLGCARGTVRSLASRGLVALRDHPELSTTAGDPHATGRPAGSTS